MTSHSAVGEALIPQWGRRLAEPFGELTHCLRQVSDEDLWRPHASTRQLGERR